MLKPEIPQDEQMRLNALRSLNILDTSSEERFDRLTRMAKRMFDVPIALVSLVDEHRQWFKSCIGLEVTETDRDISFCGHAILGDEIFIIPDAAKDARFADNPLVTNEPKIRFYAGCPLRFMDGNRLGTLCIIDTKPRNLNSEDMDALRDLASTAELELVAAQMASSDELTGIPNRRGFMMISEHSLRLCVRQHLSVSLVYIDLDNFKSINDQFGHAEGDKVLVDFAKLISSVGRDSDVIARLGGDEFVALFFNPSNRATSEFVERLQRATDAHNLNENSGYEITFSHGSVDYNPGKHQSIDALLSEGDSMMYKNKNRKKTVR